MSRTISLGASAPFSDTHQEDHTMPRKRVKGPQGYGSDGTSLPH
jgi:hypothetical protein